MKKINSSLVCLVIFTLAYTNNSTAQAGKDVSLTNSSGTKQGVNFSDPANALSAKTNAGKPTVKQVKARVWEAKINSKVASHVSNNFKDVEGLQIFNANNEPILAKFTMHNKSARVLYDKNGNWVHTVLNYKEDDLPAAVKSLVNNSFKDFSITLVQEISEGDITCCYKVLLESNTSFKEVLVYNGEITTYKEFEKRIRRL